MYLFRTIVKGRRASWYSRHMGMDLSRQKALVHAAIIIYLNGNQLHGSDQYGRRCVEYEQRAGVSCSYDGIALFRLCLGVWHHADSWRMVY